jgi:hypothetical protein
MGPAIRTLFDNKTLTPHCSFSTAQHVLQQEFGTRNFSFLHHTSSEPTPQYSEYTMFGSSQDRARQLAGRHRKNRASSSSSQWSRRSFASHTSQTQQQSESNMELRNRPHHSPEQTDIYQYFQPIYGYGKQAPPDGVPTPLSPSSLRAQQFQMDQHRMQTEYLSQIIYNNHTLPNLLAPPPSRFMATSHPAPFVHPPRTVPPYHWAIPGLIVPQSSSFAYGLPRNQPFRSLWPITA